MGYSEEIAQAINSFLVKDDWKFRFNEEKGVFEYSCSIKSKLKNVDCRIHVMDDSYRVLAYSPISANDCISEMAEFLSRANYGLNLGNFELDCDDGEIRYKCYISCESCLPGDDIIERSVYTPVMMFQRYGDGIASVSFGIKSPKEAVAECEKDL